MKNENSQLRFGWVEFSGLGGFHERMISELLENNISIWKIKFSCGKISGRISPFDYLKASRIARKNGVRLCAGKRCGLYFTLRKYQARIGLYAGFLMFIFLIAIWQTRVQDIAITGDVSRSQVLQILEECGITEGADIGQLNMSRAEHRLMLDIENCAWVDVSCEGFRVNVQVKKGVPAPEISGTAPQNMVASRPAVIVRQTVRGGFSVVGNGSGVNTGDLLVTGTVFDNEKNILLVHSDAEIIGEFTETREFYVPFVEQISTADGPQKTYKYLVLGDDIYPLFFGKASAENSLYSEETRIVTLFGQSTPLKILTGTFTKYTEKTITRSPEKAVSELKNLMENYEQNFYSDFEIMSAEESYFPDENGVRLVVKFTLQGNIAVPQPIEIDENPAVDPPEIPESQPES